MAILITGATGFIGRRLVERLLTDTPPSDIVCLVKTPGKRSEEVALESFRRSGIRIIEGDLTDRAVARESAPPVNLVFHLAANIETAAFADLGINDIGCQHLLWWLGSSMSGARLVYASSIAVLDRQGPAHDALTEASPCVPRSEYGRTKLRGERIIQAGSGPLQYDYTIVRLATVYGPGAKEGGLFDRLIRDTQQQRFLARLNWPGRTSIVHVEDAANIMVLLARRPDAANQIYCIANPDAPTVGALAENIASVVRTSSKPVHLPNWAWRLGRSLAWSRPGKLLGATLAQTTFWRLTLMIDDGFWFDTGKLQKVWTGPSRDLIEGLTEMLKYL